MMQMTLESLLSLQATRPPVIPTATQETRSIHIQSDLVDVSETAQDAGIPYRVVVSSELYEHLQRCYPNDPYENEVVLWNILSLAAFERTLNMVVPAFVFTTTIPSINGGRDCCRLRYIVGDPAVIEIA